MATKASTENLQSSAASSTSSIFDYKINYSFDGTLQWEPAANSKALAIALSYHFPMEKDLEGKMRAAIRKFIEENAAFPREDANSESESKEPSTHENSEFSQDAPDAAQIKSAAAARSVPIATGGGDSNNKSTTTISPTAAIEAARLKNHTVLEFGSAESLKVFTWDPEKAAFIGSAKGRKRRYEKVEASKVAANRGNACEEHRRQKAKCDPILCPRNGQNATDSVSTIEPPNLSGQSGLSLKYSVSENHSSDIFPRVNPKGKPGTPKENPKEKLSGIRLKSRSASLENNGIEPGGELDEGRLAKDSLAPILMPSFHVSSSPPTLFHESILSTSHELETSDENSWWLQDDFGLDPGGFFNDEVQLSEDVALATSFYAIPYANEFYDPGPIHKASPTIPRSPMPHFQEGIWTNYGCNYDWNMQYPSKKESLASTSKDVVDEAFLPSFNYRSEHFVGFGTPSTPFERRPRSNSCNFIRIMEDEGEHSTQDGSNTTPKSFSVSEAAGILPETETRGSLQLLPEKSAGRSMPSNFPSQYCSPASAVTYGFTPDSTTIGSETAGRDFAIPSGWDVSDAGLTLVGEGIFRQLMEMGPMNPVDLDWEDGLVLTKSNAGSDDHPALTSTGPTKKHVCPSKAEQAARSAEKSPPKIIPGLPKVPPTSSDLQSLKSPSRTESTCEESLMEDSPSRRKIPLPVLRELEKSIDVSLNVDPVKDLTMRLEDTHIGQ